MNRYIAFLRGINVGGHHKVPMAQLSQEMQKLHFENVRTILNSGNLIFDSNIDDLEHLEKTISSHLEKVFSFSIPTILIRSEVIYDLTRNNPFKAIKLTKTIRFYVSFLWNETGVNLELPWASDDNSYNIIEKNNKILLSVLDLSVSKTPKGMEALKKFFGKNITTRNWNTIKRIGKKLEVNSK